MDTSRRKPRHWARRFVFVPLFFLSSCIGSCVELNGCVIDLAARDADQVIEKSEASTWSGFLRFIHPGTPERPAGGEAGR